MDIATLIFRVVNPYSLTKNLKVYLLQLRNTVGEWKDVLLPPTFPHHDKLKFTGKKILPVIF